MYFGALVASASKSSRRLTVCVALSNRVPRGVASRNRLKKSRPHGSEMDIGFGLRLPHCVKAVPPSKRAGSCRLMIFKLCQSALCGLWGPISVQMQPR